MVTDMGVICCRDSAVADPLMDMLSEGAGEKVETAVGELECEEGVGRVLGDEADLCGWRGGGRVIPGSALGAILDADLRA